MADWNPFRNFHYGRHGDGGHGDDGAVADQEEMRRRPVAVAARETFAGFAAAAIRTVAEEAFVDELQQLHWTLPEWT